MNHQLDFRLSRAPWWVGLALAVTLPARAEVTCTNQNPAVPATTPTTDFMIHDNGTVTHAPTGLMWMRCSLGQTWTGTTCTGTVSTYPWQNALNAAQAFNASGGHAGHADWRLPNKNELASIVEERCWLPAINAVVFPGTPPGSWFWSSSSNAHYSDHAWGVDFYYGSVTSNVKYHTISLGRVRLVRAGQHAERFTLRYEGTVTDVRGANAPAWARVGATVLGTYAYEPANATLSRNESGLSVYWWQEPTSQLAATLNIGAQTVSRLQLHSAGVYSNWDQLGDGSLYVDGYQFTARDTPYNQEEDLSINVYRLQHEPIAPSLRVVSSEALPVATSDLKNDNATVLGGHYVQRSNETGDLWSVVWSIDSWSITISSGKLEPINGQCGPVATDGVCSTSLSATSPGLCSAGEVFLFGAVSGGWTWSCTGTNGGAAATCSETRCLIPQ